MTPLERRALRRTPALGRLDRRAFVRRSLLAGIAVGCATLLGCGPAEQLDPTPTLGSEPPRSGGAPPDALAAGPTERATPNGTAQAAHQAPAASPAPPASPGPPVVGASPAPSPLPAAMPAGSPVARRAPGSPAVAEVVVGAVYPLTGPAAPAGIAAANALRTVAEVANTRTEGLPWPWAATGGLPGLGGARVRLVIADHQGSPERGVAEARRLIERERVHAVIGGLQNAVTASVSQACEDAGIPFLAPEAPSATLHTRGLQWFFRTGPHDGHFTDGMFRFLDAFKQRTRARIETLGLTYEDTLVGEDSSRDQKELARSYGYRVVADVKYRPRTPQFTSEVQRLKTANPDVWMPTSSVADAILLAQTARQLVVSPRMMLAQGYGFADPGFLAAVGSQAEGLISRSAFLLDLRDRLPLLARVNQLYRWTAMAAGVPAADLTESSALTIVGMMTLLDAINRAGAVEPRAIRRALQQTDIPPDRLILPWRGVRFESTGQNELADVLMIQVRGGRFSTVWPFELAARDVLYPMPPWSGRR